MEKQMTLAKWVKQEAKQVLDGILKDAAEFHTSTEELLKAVIDGDYAEWIAPVAEYHVYTGDVVLPKSGKVYKKFLEEYKELRYEYRTMRDNWKDEDIKKQAWSYTAYDVLNDEVEKLARKQLEKLQKKQAI